MEFYLFCCKFLISAITDHHISHFFPKARDDPLKAALFSYMTGNRREKENKESHKDINRSFFFFNLTQSNQVAYVPIFVAL